MKFLLVVIVLVLVLVRTVVPATLSVFVLVASVVVFVAAPLDL